MSFTFATLKTAIQDYTETSETTFNNNLFYSDPGWQRKPKESLSYKKGLNDFYEWSVDKYLGDLISGKLISLSPSG